MSENQLLISSILKRCKPILSPRGPSYLYICVAIGHLRKIEVSGDPSGLVCDCYSDASRHIQTEIKKLWPEILYPTLYDAMLLSGRIPPAVNIWGPHWPVIRDQWLDLTILELEKEGR